MMHFGEDTYIGLMEYIGTHEAINTHSHHLPDNAFREFSLDSLLKGSYTDWCGAAFDKTEAGRALYLEKVRFKSYFIWLQKSIKELYGVTEPLSAGNWDEISKHISASHLDPSFTCVS
jgi:uncharacterized protein